MIRMINVGKVYRRGLVETHALSGFNLTVKAGEFVAVMGPSGSGKTTFLNVAGLLDAFDDGDYLVGGTSVRGLSDDALSRLRNLRIGFIFQSYQLIADLDVRDNIDVPLRYRGLTRADRRARIDRAIARVGLTARSRHFPAELSGGQQQRVAIARAIAGDPEIILADEPTGNLDSLMARQIMDLLEETRAAGATIVMVTHDPSLAARADRTIHVLDGRVIDPRSAARSGPRAPR